MTWLVGRTDAGTLDAERRVEVESWIRSLGVDPKNIALRVAVVEKAGGRHELHLTEYLRDESGHRFVDGTSGAPASRTIVVPVEAGTWPAWMAGLDDREIGDGPAYVHDLLDAFLGGTPLNFHRHPVPADVRRRLDEAVASGRLGTVEA